MEGVTQRVRGEEAGYDIESRERMEGTLQRFREGGREGKKRFERKIQ